MISLSGAVQIIVYLVVCGLIYWLLAYLIDAVGLPDPFAKVAKVVLIVLAVLVAISILLSLVGGVGMGPVFRP